MLVRVPPPAPSFWSSGLSSVGVRPGTGMCRNPRSQVDPYVSSRQRRASSVTAARRNDHLECFARLNLPGESRAPWLYDFFASTLPVPCASIGFDEAPS